MIPDNQPVILTLSDLSKRWQCSRVVAKRIIRDRGVPFVALSESDQRVNWNLVRFRLDSLQEWEREQQKIYVSTSEQSKFTAGSRLGDWRSDVRA